ncbi:MAG: MFS transporter [Actinomycetota bacterium]|nr:MFS transporter [Actinomycetota bacterium]
MCRVLSRLGFPAVGRHGRFVTAIGIDALGSGVWMPLSVLYFLKVTPVGLAQIGLALSIASAISLPFAFVVGQFVDRFGAKRMLQGGNLLQCLGFAAYPWVHTLVTVTLVVAIASLGRSAFWGSYSPLVVGVSERGEREKWFGFLGALRNSGFAIGGLLAALAITIGSVEVFHAVVLLNSASYLLSFVLMLRMQVHPMHREVEHRQSGGWREVLGNSGYRWLVGANFGYAMGCMALTVLLPVYVVVVLGLPGWVSGAVYVVNTVLIGVGQGLVVRRMTGSIRWRIVVLAAGFMLVSFCMLYTAGELTTAAAVAVVLAAAVVYTLGEMVGGPVLASLAAESPPAHLRGRYLAAFQLSWNGASALAPVLYLTLLALGHLEVWAALIAIVVLGALCCLPLRRRMALAAQQVTNAPVAVAGA